MGKLLALVAAVAFSVQIYVENFVKDSIVVMYPTVLSLDTVGSGENISCTGVAIGQTHLLTARHCVQHPGEIAVNKKFKAKLLKVSETQDLALYQLVDGKFDAYAPLLLRDVEHLEDLVSVGFPISENIGHFVTEEGKMQGLTTLNDGKHFYLMSVPIYPGNSGGPIFVWDMGRWRLAGISVAIAGFMTANWTIQLAPQLSFGMFDLKEFLVEGE